MAIVWVVLKVVLWVLLVLLALLLIVLFLPITAEIKYTAQDGVLLKVGALFLRLQLFPSKPKKQRWWHRKQKPNAEATEPQKPPQTAQPVTEQEPQVQPEAETKEHTKEQTPQPETAQSAPKQQPQPQPAATGQAAKTASEPANKQPNPKKQKPVSKMNLKDVAKQEPVGKKLQFSLDLVKKFLPLAGTSMKRLLWSLRIHHICINLPVHADDAAKTAIKVGQINAGLGAGFGVLQNFLRLRFGQTEIWPDYHGEHKQEAFFSCKITAQLYIMLIVGVWLLLQLRKEKII